MIIRKWITSVEETARSIESGRAPPPSAPQLTYRRGMKVYHSVFGEGTVIDSRLSAGDEEVSVKFEQYGTKLLSAAFAKLQILK